MEKINFINAKQPAINATNLNQLQNNMEKGIKEGIEESINELSTKKAKLAITEDSEKGAIVTIPLSYKVGIGALDVYLKGERLIICTGSDETTGSYLEVGTVDSISNQIKLTSDWKLEVGDYLEFIVRGEWS